MTNLSDTERSALNLLAHHPDGCDEVTLLADGVTVGLLARLVIDGFTTLERKRANEKRTVLWMTDHRGGPSGDRAMKRTLSWRDHSQ
jgi:hypothetical protein